MPEEKYEMGRQQLANPSGQRGPMNRPARLRVSVVIQSFSQFPNRNFIGFFGGT